MASAISMMGGAYFVGRVELLNWLNDLLQLDYTKIEETSTGAAVCQLMDILFPGKVPLGKVNFNAKQEYESTQNYKVLQRVWDQQGIEKRIDVPKLTKGKYQDNLEFMQWVKAYFDMYTEGSPIGYDPVMRRMEVKANYSKDKNKACGAPAPKKATKAPVAITTKTPVTSKAPTAAKAPVQATKPVGAKIPVNAAPTAAKTPASAAPKVAVTSKKSSKATPVVNLASKENTKENRPARSSAPGPRIESKEGEVAVRSENKEAIKNLEKKIVLLEEAMQNLERERDFYYNKLCEVEVLIQDNEDAQVPVLDEIVKVLYKTDE